MQGSVGSLLVFVAVSALVLLVLSLLTLRGAGGSSRWSETARGLLERLPALGGPLLPPQGRERQRLSARLLKAGLYQPQALPYLLGAKAALMLLGAALGALVFLLPVRAHWGAAAMIGGAVLG